MEEDNKWDPQRCKVALDLHLAKFNYYMAKKDWKVAVKELQHALNSVIEILDHANATLKKIADRYQKERGAPRLEGGIRTERISEDTVLIEYPGDKVVLKKELSPPNKRNII